METQVFFLLLYSILSSFRHRHHFPILQMMMCQRVLSKIRLCHHRCYCRRLAVCQPSPDPRCYYSLCYCVVLS